MSTETHLDAIALLKADHRLVEDLFTKFAAASGASARQALVKQICTALSVHTIIEEEIFYPACRGHIDASLGSEAYVEHDGAKVLIGELEASAPDEPFYAAKVKVLSEEIKHHVHEEEMPSSGMFAQAREAGLDMDALGARLSQRKAVLMAQIKANGLQPPETRTFVADALKRGAPVDISHHRMG